MSEIRLKKINSIFEHNLVIIVIVTMLGNEPGHFIDQKSKNQSHYLFTPQFVNNSNLFSAFFYKIFFSKPINMKYFKVSKYYNTCTANVFSVIFTVIPLYCLHLITAPSTVEKCVLEKLCPYKRKLVLNFQLNAYKFLSESIMNELKWEFNMDFTPIDNSLIKQALKMFLQNITCTITTTMYGQSYEIKLPSQAFIDQISSPWEKIKTGWVL